MFAFLRLNGARIVEKSGHALLHRRRANRTKIASRAARRTPRLEPLEPRQLMARDAILDWNAVMLQANANDHALAHPEEGGPVLTARAFAIASLAMYDAYNSIKHTGTP